MPQHAPCAYSKILGPLHGPFLNIVPSLSPLNVSASPCANREAIKLRYNVRRRIVSGARNEEYVSSKYTGGS